MRDAYKQSMIHRLHLVNWKSHADSEITFSGGTNVIVGINGAGKSSILEAILFALYGELPGGATYEKIMRRGAPRDARGIVELELDVNGKRITIYREFSRKGQTRARIRGDVKTLTEKPSQVTEEIVKLIGMDRKTFEKAVYGRQGEIAALLNDRSERKRLINRILGIEKLQILQSAINSAIVRLRRIAGSADISTLEKELNEARKRKEEVDSDMEKIREQLRSWKEERQSAERRLHALRQELAKTEGLLRRARAAKQELDRLLGIKKNLEERIEQLERMGVSPADEKTVSELKRRYSVLEQVARKIDELTALKSRLQAMAERRIEKPDVDTAARALERAEEQIRQVREKLASKRKEKAELERQLSELERERQMLSRRAELLSSVRKKIEQLRKRLEELGTLETIERTIQRIAEEISAAETEIRQESTFVEALRSASACPVCGSMLSEEKRRELLDKHSKRIKTLREKVAQLKRDLERLRREQAESRQINDEIQKLSAQLGALEEIKKRMVELDEKIKRIRARIDEAKGQIRELEERAARARKELESARENMAKLEKRLREYEEVERARTELETIEAKLKELGERPDLSTLREEIARAEKGLELAKDRARLDEVYRRINELRGEAERAESLEEQAKQLRDAISKEYAQLKALEARISAEEKRLKSTEELKRTLERRIKDIEQKITEIADATERKSILESVAKIVAAAGEQVKESRLAAINSILNTVWATLYPRKDIVELRIVPEKNDYRIYARTASGEQIDVDSLSGGERFDVALALRIAVAAAWGRSMGMLILDEPTHNLDEDATDALAEVLRHLPGDSFNQILVITHNEALKKAATGKIIVVERDKERGGPSIVREVPVTVE